MRAASPGVERADQGVLELPDTAFDGERSLEDLLLILNFERICSKKVLKMGRDFSRRLLEKTTEHPYYLEDSNKADQPGVPAAQYMVDDMVGSNCLLRVILKQVPQNHIRIESNHQRNLFVAPASMATSISSTEIGREGFGTLPLSVDVGILGKITTAPSG
jgi:hypothetical protein